mgnify:FL=1
MLEITNKNFEEVVLKSKKPVVVDFWAEWCAPCRMISPLMEELSKEYKDDIEIVKCDVDKNPELCEQFKIKSIPAVFFMKNGEVFDTKIGAGNGENRRDKTEPIQ